MNHTPDEACPKPRKELKEEKKGVDVAGKTLNYRVGGMHVHYMINSSDGQRQLQQLLPSSAELPCV